MSPEKNATIVMTTSGTKGTTLLTTISTTMSLSVYSSRAISPSVATSTKTAIATIGSSQEEPSGETTVDTMITTTAVVLEANTVSRTLVQSSVILFGWEDAPIVDSALRTALSSALGVNASQVTIISSRPIIGSDSRRLAAGI